MRLLARISEQSQKRIVIITGDPTIGNLAGLANIPVAKNLQTKPEVIDVPILKIDNGEDVIDGNELSVGDLSKTVGDDTDRLKESAIAEIALNQIDSNDKSAHPVTRQTAKTSKVPDFRNFRKKFIFIGLGAVVLIGVFVWAIWFAPRATIAITAKTSNISISERVTLKTEVATNTDTGQIRVSSQEKKVDLSVEFTATGEKNAGDKATGVVKLTRNSPNSTTLPAGTALRSSSGAKFLTSNAVTIPRSTSFTENPDCFPLCAGTADVNVVASEGGASFNGAVGAVSGDLNGASGAFSGPTSGGTDRMIKAVSQSDLDKATEQLNAKKVNNLRSDLAKSFGDSSIAIEESFREKRSEPTSSIPLDGEANGQVTLKTVVSGTMFAVDRAELDSFLTSIAKKEISTKKSQKIYNNGLAGVQLTQFSDNNGNLTAHLGAQASIGPVIDEAVVKEQARGLRYGDIQSKLESIPGIDTVDTQFWPFWVRSVPNDVSRIEVKFSVSNANS